MKNGKEQIDNKKYWGSMVQNNYTMVTKWLHNGYTMVTQWLQNGYTMVTL